MKAVTAGMSQIRMFRQYPFVNKTLLMACLARFYQQQQQLYLFSYLKFNFIVRMTERNLNWGEGLLTSELLVSFFFFFLYALWVFNYYLMYFFCLKVGEGGKAP